MPAVLTYQGSKIVPNLGNVRVESNGSAVGIEGVPVLVDLVVQDTDGTPEGWVATVAVDGLLVRLVCLRVLLLRHVAPSEQIPALRIGLVWQGDQQCYLQRASGHVQLTGIDRLLQVLNGLLLAAEAGALLVVQPPELLQDFGVVGVSLKNTCVG
jgi:hypothetical protein